MRVRTQWLIALLVLQFLSCVSAGKGKCKGKSKGKGESKSKGKGKGKGKSKGSSCEEENDHKPKPTDEIFAEHTTEIKQASQSDVKVINDVKKRMAAMERRVKGYRLDFIRRQRAYEQKKRTNKKKNKDIITVELDKLDNEDVKIDKKCKGKKNDQCTKLKKAHEKKSGIMLDTLENQIHSEATQLMEKYLSDLTEMGLKSEKQKLDILADLTYILGVVGTVDKGLNELVNEVEETVTQQLENIVVEKDKIAEEIHRIQKIVYGNICFDFVGVNNVIKSQSDKDIFEIEVSRALELAFACDGLDVQVLSVKIVKQELIPFETRTRRRNLRNLALSSSSSSLSKKRLLKNNKNKSKGKLRVGTLMAWICNCSSKDDPITDVYGRRLREEETMDALESAQQQQQQQQQRILWTSSIEHKFGSTVKRHMTSVFEDLEDVQTVPCRGMDWTKKQLSFDY